MLPCPIKFVTGFDCPGCGLQRSFYLLLKGEFSESFLQFPPLLFFIITLIFLSVHLYKKQDVSRKRMMLSFYATSSVMMINYFYKIATGQVFWFLINSKNYPPYSKLPCFDETVTFFSGLASTLPIILASILNDFEISIMDAATLSLT